MFLLVKETYRDGGPEGQVTYVWAEVGVRQLSFSEILLLYLILGIFDVKHKQECLQEEDKLRMPSCG